jgi:DNA-binding XRE family transcriptional regulator
MREEIRDAIARVEAQRAEEAREVLDRWRRGDRRTIQSIRGRSFKFDAVRAAAAADPTTHPMRKIRHAADMTAAELATKAKVTRRTVVEIELRQRQARPRTLRKLAKALDVTVADITP